MGEFSKQNITIEEHLENDDQPLIKAKVSSQGRAKFAYCFRTSVLFGIHEKSFIHV